MHANGSAGGDLESTLTSLGRVLVGNATGCTVTGDVSSNLLNVDPLLAARQTQPGGMVFHRLRLASRAADAVPLDRCSDVRGLGLRVDALGAMRPGVGGSACDIGAVEGVKDVLFANGFEAP